MMNGVLARLMQAMQGQAHTAGATADDGPSMPGDDQMQQAFAGQPDVMQGQTGPEMPGSAPNMMDMGGGPQYGPDASLMADPSMQVQGGGAPQMAAEQGGGMDPGILSALMDGADNHAKGGDEGYGNTAALDQMGIVAKPTNQADGGYGGDGFEWQNNPPSNMPLQQEPGDLWAPKAQSLQSMFSSSPAMGGRMSTK